VLVFKLASFVATVVLTSVAFRHLYALINEGQVAKAKAAARPNRPARDSVRLRQDPRTGIYYPEN
jgi:hypothetical protein